MTARRIEPTPVACPAAGAVVPMAERTAAGGTASASALLSHAGAAALVGVSARTVRRLWMAGSFPRPVRFPGLRGLRFRTEEVQAWVQAGAKV